MCAEMLPIFGFCFRDVFDPLQFICSYKKLQKKVLNVVISSLRWDQAAKIHRDQDHVKHDHVEVGALLALGL